MQVHRTPLAAACSRHTGRRYDAGTAASNAAGSFPTPRGEALLVPGQHWRWPGGPKFLRQRQARGWLLEGFRRSCALLVGCPAALAGAAARLGRYHGAVRGAPGCWWCLCHLQKGDSRVQLRADAQYIMVQVTGRGEPRLFRDWPSCRLEHVSCGNVGSPEKINKARPSFEPRLSVIKRSAGWAVAAWDRFDTLMSAKVYRRCQVINLLLNATHILDARSS